MQIESNDGALYELINLWISLDKFLRVNDVHVPKPSLYTAGESAKKLVSIFLLACHFLCFKTKIYN